MIVPPAESKPVLGPDDLRAHVETRNLEGLLDLTRVPTRMPDIRDGAWKQHPGLPPIDAIVVGHLSQLASVEIYASALSPGRIVIHPIGRVRDHQVWFGPGQQALRIGVEGAVTTDKSWRRESKDRRAEQRARWANPARHPDRSALPSYARLALPVPPR